MKKYLQALAKELVATSKGVFALTCFIAMLFASLIVGDYLVSPRFGFIVWCLMMAWTVRGFMVSVPEVTGLVTVSYFGGELQTYGTGLHFRFPWEQVRVGNYINLRLVTVTKEGTYPSKDGPLMLVKWSYQYEPISQRLDRYISADDSTIKDGLGEVGGSILSVQIGAMEADNCKKNQHEIETALKKKFEETTPPPGELYGIKLVRVSLSDVDYEPTVQKVRATQKIAKALQGIAKDITDQHKDISGKDAMNTAMVINGDVKKTVTEVEGRAGEAIAALIMAAAGAGKEKK